MPFYKRCNAGGDCDQVTAPAKAAAAPTWPTLIPGGNAANPSDWVYQCASGKTACPCPPKAGDTCGCFVVATKHVYDPPPAAINNYDETQKYYDAAPSTGAGGVPDYSKMLDQKTQKADHPTTKPPGTGTQSWWTISCICLKYPIEETVSMRLTIPEGEYASVLKELREKFGHKNVEELPTSAIGLNA